MDDNKIQKLYEQMVEKEQVDIEKKQPTMIEQLQARIKALEEAVDIINKRMV